MRGGLALADAAGVLAADVLHAVARAQLLYKYLPEPMRNPQTFEWMLSNPEYRKQLEAMMQQQARPRLDPAPWHALSHVVVRLPGLPSSSVHLDERRFEMTSELEAGSFCEGKNL